MAKKNNLSRRSFLAASALTGTAPMFLPSSAKGANERLNVGVIGVGGRGATDLAAMGGENAVHIVEVVPVSRGIDIALIRCASIVGILPLAPTVISI